MFYSIIHSSTIWSNMLNNKRNLRIFLFGTVCYMTFHAILFSKYGDKIKLIRNYIYYIWIVDVITMAFIYKKINKLSEMTNLENMQDQLIVNDTYRDEMQNRLRQNNAIQLTRVPELNRTIVQRTMVIQVSNHEDDDKDDYKSVSELKEQDVIKPKIEQIDNVVSTEETGEESKDANANEDINENSDENSDEGSNEGSNEGSDEGSDEEDNDEKSMTEQSIPVYKSQ